MYDWNESKVFDTVFRAAVDSIIEIGFDSGNLLDGRYVIGWVEIRL